MKFSYALVMKYSGVDTPSFLLALVPTKDIRVKLCNWAKGIDFKETPELEPEKELHLTLRYWKKEKFDDYKKIQEALRKETFTDKIIEVKEDELSYEILGDKGAFVIRIENTEVDDIQKKIDDIIQKVGVPASDFPKFKGHVTLAYGIKEVPKDLPEINFNIKFDAVRFTDNTDDVLWIEKI